MDVFGVVNFSGMKSLIIEVSLTFPTTSLDPNSFQSELYLRTHQYRLVGKLHNLLSFTSMDIDNYRREFDC